MDTCSQWLNQTKCKHNFFFLVLQGFITKGTSQRKKLLLSVIKYSVVAKIMDGALMVVFCTVWKSEKISVLLSKLLHPSSSSPRVPLLHVLLWLFSSLHLLALCHRLLRHRLWAFFVSPLVPSIPRHDKTFSVSWNPLAVWFNAPSSDSHTQLCWMDTRVQYHCNCLSLELTDPLFSLA